MAAIDKLIFYGNPLLRQHSEEVKEFTPEIHTVIDELIEVAKSERAVGISAIQLGYPYRIFAVCIDHWEKDIRTPGEVFVYVNPTVSDPSEETRVIEEGCMSIPGVYIPVERPRSITVSALDRDGNPFTQTLHDFEARVRMHENDHLNGVLTVDRLPKSLRQNYEPQLRKIKKTLGT